MFKRVRWMMLGAFAGAGGSIWAQRKIRRQAARYLPDQMAAQARDRVARASDDLRAAIGEGRAAMAEREAELRARLPGNPSAVPLPLPGARGEVIEARSFEIRDHESAGEVAVPNLESQHRDQARPRRRRRGRGSGPSSSAEQRFPG